MSQVSYETVLESLETVVSELNHTNNDRTRGLRCTPFGAVTSVDPCPHFCGPLCEAYRA